MRMKLRTMVRNSMCILAVAVALIIPTALCAVSTESTEHYAVVCSLLHEYFHAAATSMKVATEVLRRVSETPGISTTARSTATAMWQYTSGEYDRYLQELDKLARDGVATRNKTILDVSLQIASKSGNLDDCISNMEFMKTYNARRVDSLLRMYRAQEELLSTNMQRLSTAERADIRAVMSILADAHAYHVDQRRI